MTPTSWPLTGVAAALPQRDVNTDIIYPQGYLRRTDIASMDRYLFHGLRFDAAGAPDPSFVLNRAPWTDASILVAGSNFGSGSSREHAVWALQAFGFRVIISSLFADIFKSNCLNNAIAPLTVAEADLARCLEAAADPQTSPFTVDLEAGCITSHVIGTVPFTLAPADRQRILNNRDAIDDTMASETAIARHEADAVRQSPWLGLGLGLGLGSERSNA